MDSCRSGLVWATLFLMAQNPLSRRLLILGWGNVVIALVMPLKLLYLYLRALQVFSPSYGSGSYGVTGILSIGLGFLAGCSGRGILKVRPWATKMTCIAAGVWLGYTIDGIYTLAVHGTERQLLFVIRNGSEYWWNWSISHFEDSGMIEIPFLVWWVYGVGTILRSQFPGAPVDPGTRVIRGLLLVVGFAFMGALMREFQILVDTSLYSTR